MTIAGTLTLPTGHGPFPAVVLISGSGPHDRDESVMGHKPFWVLSDYLTRRGIAVLRTDDRGVGKSTGTFANATINDFATDIEAGINYLATVPEISKTVGLIGHSAGADIAAMIAARNPNIKFIVLMAGSGVRGRDLLVEQVRMLNIAAGENAHEADMNAAKESDILDLVISDAQPSKLREELAKISPSEDLDLQLQRLNSPWFRSFLSHNPADDLKKVHCPVLVLNGSLDRQVPPRQNLPEICKALAEAPSLNFEIHEFNGLNHLFQKAQTGSPDEYSKISETISPDVLNTIVGWIKTTVHI